MGLEIRQPLLTDIQGNYGTGETPTAESCAIEVERPTTDERIFITWSVFRRISEYLHPDDWPSMLSFSIQNIPHREINISLIRRMITDRYLRSKMPQVSSDALFKRVLAFMNGEDLSNADRTQIQQMLSEFFPNLNALSVSEQQAIWLQIRSKTPILTEAFLRYMTWQTGQLHQEDLDGKTTRLSSIDLHRIVVFIRQLYRSISNPTLRGCLRNKGSSSFWIILADFRTQNWGVIYNT